MTLRTAQRASRSAPVSLPKFILKRGESYAVRYTVPLALQGAAGRKEIVRSLGTTNLKEALERRDQALEEIRRTLLEPPSEKPCKPGRYGERDDPLAGTSVRATGHRWLAQSDGIKNSTKARYRQHLKAFEDFSGNIEVSKIDRKLALEFIEHIRVTPSERTGEPLSARSIGSYQVCLSAWWRVPEVCSPGWRPADPR